MIIYAALLFGIALGGICILELIEMWTIRIPKQTTFIYCKCGNEMCSDGSFVSDTTENGENHVKYRCQNCGMEHDYAFDVAPFPVPWTEIRRPK